MSSLAGILIGAALNGTDGCVDVTFHYLDNVTHCRRELHRFEVLMNCLYFVFVLISYCVYPLAGSLYTGMLNSPFTPLSPAPLDTVVSIPPHHPPAAVHTHTFYELLLPLI